MKRPSLPLVSSLLILLLPAEAFVALGILRTLVLRRTTHAAYVDAGSLSLLGPHLLHLGLSRRLTW